MMKAIKLSAEKLIPPGINIAREVRTLIGGAVIAFLYSLGFFFRYSDAYHELFDYVGGKRVLLEGAQMRSFGALWGNSHYGFYILALLSLAFIIYHYAYFYQGSKSIYLMKRLPNRLERHYRCITLPVLYAIASVLLSVAVMLLYLAFYLIFTPKGCISPAEWQIPWGILL